MPELMSPDAGMRRELTAVRVARIAARQWGIVTRAQLLACGFSASGILRWIANGRLFEVYRGVYALGHTCISEEGRLAAALFHAGSGAALSHPTAAWWWEVTPTHNEAIHVSVLRRRRLDDGLVVHHPRKLVRVIHRKLPVTPLARTLVDFAADAPERAVRKAVAEAEYRHGLDPRALLSVLGRGVPGSAALRSALESHMPELARTASPLEEDFLFFCERYDLRLPLVNRRVEGKKVDAFWPKERLIVELDSISAHGSAPRRLVDRERDLHLRRLGYEVRRYTWHQVQTTPDAVADDLRATLIARS